MILNKYFCYVMTLKMLGRPQVVAPREGPHALISTDVHARAAQLGAVHAAPLHCGGGVDQPSRRAQRALFEELGRGSMGMNV